MRTFDFRTTLTGDEGEDIPLLVECRYRPAQRSRGERLDPPTDDSVEILSIETADGAEFDADDDQLAELESIALNHLPDEYEQF